MHYIVLAIYVYISIFVYQLSFITKKFLFLFFMQTKFTLYYKNILWLKILIIILYINI